MYGWLQRDRRFEPQAIKVYNDSLTRIDPSFLLRTHPARWLKVSIRNFDDEYAEVAVQIFGNDRFTGQLFYGAAVGLIKNVEKASDGIDVPITLDTRLQPQDPPGGEIGWPSLPIGSYIYLSLWLSAAVPSTPADVAVYYLEWSYDVLADFVDALRLNLRLCPFSETTGRGYSVPDDVVVMAESDLDRNDVKARLKDSLVVIHSPVEIKPDVERSGGFGRKGRQFEAMISVFARDARGLDPKKEYAVEYLALLLADIEERLNPQATVNTLGGYLYDSDYEQEEEVSDGSHDAGPNVVVARGRFIGYKIFYDEGTTEVIPAGNGVVFNFNQGFIRSGDSILENDASLFYVAATKTYHALSIRGVYGSTYGSQYFAHYTSPDCRSWEETDLVQIGTGTEPSWRAQVWAPQVFENPVYGVGEEPLNGYKYLMVFTGVSKMVVDTLTEQKIGLAGSNSDSLANGTWTIIGPAGPADDNPIYWSGMDDTGNGGSYPTGAPWASWGGAGNLTSRDPHVYFDGTDWRLLLTCEWLVEDKNCIGNAKFPGGSIPDFTSPTHEDNAIVVATYDGEWLYESSIMERIGGLFHLMVKGRYGTRYQNGTGIFGPPWNPTTNDLGVPLLYSTLPIGNGSSGGEGIELAEIEGEASIFLAMSFLVLSGPPPFLVKKIVELDFSGVALGGVPAVAAAYRIAGLVGLDEGVMDRALRWTIQDANGSLGAFYYQPVWGDQAAACGYDPSGMTGNSYIATHFKHWNPTATSTFASGQQWSNYTRTGWIKSSTFTITRDRISLMVAGGSNELFSFVALFNADDDRLLFLETGTGDHTLTLREWDTTDIIGLGVYLVIADLGTSDGDCIDVDAITEYNSAGRGDTGVPSTPIIGGAKLEDLVT